MRIVKTISMKNYQFPDFLEILTRSCKYMGIWNNQYGSKRMGRIDVIKVTRNVKDSFSHSFARSKHQAMSSFSH